MGKANYKRNRIVNLDGKPVLRVSPQLAADIGLDESIVLLQLEFLIGITQHEHDGRRWTFQSLEDMRQYFPFWPRSTIDRKIHKLQDAKLIEVANYNRRKADRTRWFALTDAAIEKLKALGLSQNGTAIPACETAFPQNGTGSRIPFPTSGTTLPEISSETSAKKSQKKSEALLFEEAKPPISPEEAERRLADARRMREHLQTMPPPAPRARDKFGGVIPREGVENAPSPSVAAQ